MTDSRRHELARFLRSRRERVTPSQVGLTGTGPRRTPGLRREEVAALADVGVTWYTWLEQGRAITASSQILDAVGRALLLGPDERSHLLRLGGYPAPGAAPLPCVVGDAHRELLDALLPIPACVQTSRFDVLAHNRTYRFLINDIERFPESERNTALLNFLDPQWRRSYRNWADVSAGIVARLRASMAVHLDDPDWTTLVERLRRASAEFRELWDRGDVRDTDPEPKHFHNPDVGLLALRFTRLHLEEAAQVRLMAATPLDERTRARLAALDDAHRDEPRVTCRTAAQTSVLRCDTKPVSSGGPSGR